MAGRKSSFFSVATLETVTRIAPPFFSVPTCPIFPNHTALWRGRIVAVYRRIIYSKAPCFLGSAPFHFSDTFRHIAARSRPT